VSDCEIAQYYKAEYRMARKEHDCCECYAPIEKNEKYLEVRACWDGRPSIERQHLLCQKACEFVRDTGLNDDECLYFGEFKEWYREFVKGGWHTTAGMDERRKLFLFMLHIKRRERLSRSKNP
jgi:hypothetical protein